MTSGLLRLVRRVREREGQHLVSTFIPEPGTEPLRPNESYLRVWLADMFLAHDQQWLAGRYPMAHATITFRYAGQQRSFTRTCRPPEGQLGPGERRNYELVPLVPWNGGVVEIDAGLSALRGGSPLGAALDAIGELSKLVGPPLSSAIALSDQIARGVEHVLEAAEEDVLLALHEGFSRADGGGRELRPGWWVVVGATAQQVPPAELAIEDDVLVQRTADGVRRVTGFDYLVLRLAGQSDRDDWRFADFENLIGRALDALAAGDEGGWKTFGNAAIRLADRSPDLTLGDRGIVAEAIQKELEAAKGRGLGAAGGPPPTLGEIVARHARTPQSRAVRPVPALEHLLLS